MRLLADKGALKTPACRRLRARVVKAVLREERLCKAAGKGKWSAAKDRSCDRAGVQRDKADRAYVRACKTHYRRR